MDYEFGLFDSVINGPLSPFRSSPTDTLKYRAHLAEKYPTCYFIILASFKRMGTKYILESKTVANSLNTSIYEGLSRQQDLFQEMPAEHLAFDVYKLLEIKEADVYSIEYLNQSTKSVLRIKQIMACEDLEPSEARYYYYADILRDETVRIKQEMQRAVFEFRKPKEIQLYIHNMQQSIINLSYQVLRLYSDKQLNTIYHPAETFTDVDILNCCFIALERLLRFFEKHYLKYIDENIQVPFRSSLIKLYRIPEKLERVKSCLLNAQINPALLKIVYTPLLKLNSISAEARITYRELIYCNTYLDAFYNGIKGNGESLNEAEITEVLHRVNYNSIDLYVYKIGAIKDRINEMETTPEKIDYLYHRLKLVNQRSCRVNIKYDPGLPNLKEQLSVWIEEEITYLNKHLALSSRPPTANLFTDQERPKLQSAFTVAQLALFYRVQADAGIITNRMQTDIFRHISENYRTSKAVDISADSVKNRFYNIDDTAIEAVRQKTIEILNQLKYVQPGSA